MAPLPPIAPVVAPERSGPAWPSEGAPLWTLVPEIPRGWRERRVVIDPGHGAPPDNFGNQNVDCRREADEMWRVAERLIGRLERPGVFSVRSARPGGALTDYGARIAMADGWPADALISLHSDARAGTGPPDPASPCPRPSGSTGFSVLWSDEGGASLVLARRRLAERVAARMIEAGFPPYGGEGYSGLYEGDPENPGVFVDRHEPSQRIRMLRRPRIPSIIVETHQAMDPSEVARWGEPQTVDVFASALRVALVDFLGPG